MSSYASKVYHEQGGDRLIVSSGGSIVLESGSSLSLGSTVTFGLGGVTPVSQQAFIADPTGGATTDTQARAAIASILDVLIAFGLIASS